jgi:hypothetical protein
MNQQKRLLGYLAEHKRASTNELRSQLSIAHPDTIVSRIRAVYGYGAIRGYWMDGKNQFGEAVRFMVYEISDELTKKKEPFPTESVFRNLH